MNKVTEFEDTCQITNVKSGMTVDAELINFKEKEMLIATINRQVKVHLHWDERAGKYMGSYAGMEFLSDGPRSYTFRTSR